MRLDAARVRAAARGRWLAVVFPHLAPELGPAVAACPRHVACPVHGGRNGDAFRLYTDADETGGAVCNTCGPRADGFEVLRWLRGWTFPEALAAVADALGLAPAGTLRGPLPPLPPPPAPRPPPDPERLKGVCRALWQSAEPDAAFVRAYLAARGAELPTLPPDLRGAMALTYYAPGGWSLGDFPSMVALLRAGHGTVRGLHRTYLAPGGPGKADLRDPATGAALPVKKLLSFAPGACSGCAVHLAEPDAGTLAVCEGIENAACIQAATGVPTWAAYSAGALGKLDLPADVTRLELWPDGDAPGIAAAKALADRCASRGVVVRIFRTWQEGTP